MISSDGRAVGVLVTVGIHTAGIGTSGVDAGLIGITRIPRQEARAEQVLDTTLTLQTAGLLEVLLLAAGDEPGARGHRLAFPPPDPEGRGGATHPPRREANTSLAIATAEMTILRWLDIAVLVIALPAFIALDAPLLGYVVCACAWLVGRTAHLLAGRRANAALAEGNRNQALGVMAAASLGRAWLVALAVLIVGLNEREAGLAGALLAVALFSAYFAGLAIERLFDPERSRV